MGSYLHNIKLDYAGARAQYLEGLKRDPNNAELLGGSGDRWSACSASSTTRSTYAQQAPTVDPRSVDRRGALPVRSTTCVASGGAPRLGSRAGARAATTSALIQGKAFAYLSLGTLDSVHALVEQKLKIVDTTALLVRFALYQETMWTLPPSLWPKILKLTVRTSAATRGTGDSSSATRIGSGRYRARRAISATRRSRRSRRSSRTSPSVRSFTSCAAARSRSADIAREAIVEADGRSSCARRRSTRRIRPYVHFQVARILIQSGEYERALDLIEPLMTTPASRRDAGILADRSELRAVEGDGAVRGAARARQIGVPLC